MNARIRDYCLRRGCSVFEVEGGLEYLVHGWERTVADVARGYRGLLAQQFVSDLRVRQILHEVWPLAQPEEQQEFGARLQVADARFLEHTVEVTKPAPVLVGNGSAPGTNATPGTAGRWDAPALVSPEQWWYGREPKVRDEDW